MFIVQCGVYDDSKNNRILLHEAFRESNLSAIAVFIADEGANYDKVIVRSEETNEDWTISALILAASIKGIPEP